MSAFDISFRDFKFLRFQWVRLQPQKFFRLVLNPKKDTLFFDVIIILSYENKKIIYHIIYLYYFGFNFDRKST